MLSRCVKSGGWGVHNCFQVQDAGVRCSGELYDVVEDDECVCACVLTCTC